jgi:hypothetical protein
VRDLSVFRGSFSVAPCPNLAVRFTTFSSLHVAPRLIVERVRGRHAHHLVVVVIRHGRRRVDVEAKHVHLPPNTLPRPMSADGASAVERKRKVARAHLLAHGQRKHDALHPRGCRVPPRHRHHPATTDPTRSGQLFHPTRQARGNESVCTLRCCNPPPPPAPPTSLSLSLSLSLRIPPALACRTPCGTRRMTRRSCDCPCSTLSLSLSLSRSAPRLR